MQGPLANGLFLTERREGRSGSNLGPREMFSISWIAQRCLACRKIPNFKVRVLKFFLLFFFKISTKGTKSKNLFFAFI
jgi:hypothetical protein